MAGRAVGCEIRRATAQNASYRADLVATMLLSGNSPILLPRALTTWPHSSVRAEGMPTACAD